MNAPLRPTLLVLGALSLGGAVAFQMIGTAQAEPSTLRTTDNKGQVIELGGRDGGHAIELGGRDGGHAIELGNERGHGIGLGKEGGHASERGKEGGHAIELGKEGGHAIELGAGTAVTPSRSSLVKFRSIDHTAEGTSRLRPRW